MQLRAILYYILLYLALSIIINGLFSEPLDEQDIVLNTCIDICNNFQGNIA